MIDMSTQMSPMIITAVQPKRTIKRMDAESARGIHMGENTHHHDHVIAPNNLAITKMNVKI